VICGIVLPTVAKREVVAMAPTLLPATAANILDDKDTFEVFGDDENDDKPKKKKEEKGEGGKSLAEMLARLKG
jgi:hypothetical protein